MVWHPKRQSFMIPGESRPSHKIYVISNIFQLTAFPQDTEYVAQDAALKSGYPCVISDKRIVSVNIDHYYKWQFTTDTIRCPWMK